MIQKGRRMVDEQSGQSAAAGLPALSVGALLAEARAAKGRDLPEIARETRVPLRHLMAIEADDHDALPALPYALGFVKAFARAVNLDAEAIGARFRAETRLSPHVPTPSSLEPVDEQRLPSRGLAYGALAALVVVLGGLGLYGAGVFDPAPKPGTIAVVVPEPGDPAVEAAASDPAAAPAPAAPATIPTTGPVLLTAREDVWVKIYDRSSGKRAFMGVLFAGKNWPVPDGSNLTLRAGRAGVIEVRVAGALLPALGDRNQTIDGVVLTAPALAERFAGMAPVQQTAMPAPAQTVAPAAPAGTGTGA
jgi:cytoskeleton protein RodZ